MPDLCEVTIDGTYSGTYYVPSNQVQYLTSDFKNNGSTTIYMYKTYGDSYPQIRISSNGYPTYYSQNNYSGVVLTDVSSVVFNKQAMVYRSQPFYSLFNSVLLCLLAVAVLLRRT